MLPLKQRQYVFFIFLTRLACMAACWIVLFFGFSFQAEASLQLSVTPSKGGNSLEFGRVDSNLMGEQDVRVRISATGNERYQVFQRVVDPFVNERGQQVDLGVVQTYFQSGSNSFGTAYLQGISLIGYSDQLVYSSGQNGDSDSFRIIYSIDPKKLKVEGGFLGRILYTVRSLEGGGQQQVFLNVRFESSQQLKVNVSGSKSIHGIELNDRDDFHGVDSVEIEYSGFIGERLTIDQEVVVFPQNKLFEEMQSDLIQISTVTEDGTGSYSSQSDLPRKQVQVFSSEKREGSVLINFMLNPNMRGKYQSGEFNGRVKYHIDDGTERKEYELDLKVVIEPLFQLDVSLPPGGIAFDHILPNEPPQVLEVKVKVDTNLKNPYVITQRTLAPMTNEKGQEFDSRYFQMKVEFDSEGGGEKSSYGQFKPVSTGDVPIVFSNRDGDPLTFSVFYRLSAYADMEPGKYSTSIIYSLGER